MLAENPFAGLSDVAAVPVHDWSLQEYIDHPAPSRSTLWAFYTAKSPYHFRWDQDNGPEKDSDAMLLGSAIHLAVLEPENYGARTRVWTLGVACEMAEEWGLPKPSGSSVARRGKVWERYKAECDKNRRLLLTPAQNEAAQRIADWVRTRKGIRKLFADGLVEVSIVAEEGGREYKVRLDFGDTGRRWIVEVKTTYKLDDWHYYRTSRDHGYHMQAAMQIDAAEAAGLGLVEYYRLWVCTKGAPWAEMRRTQAAEIAEGRKVFREAHAAWWACTESGEWAVPELEVPVPEAIWEEVR